MSPIRHTKSLNKNRSALVERFGARQCKMVPDGLSEIIPTPFGSPFVLGLIAGRPDHRQDPGSDRLAQNRPCRDDGSQIGVVRGRWGILGYIGHVG